MQMTSKEHVYDVIVIGGGVAGLSAAQELLRHGCGNICVVEAQNRLGGRVKQVTGLVPWALDAGAELVHGEDSTIASLLSQDLKADLLKKEYPNYVYWQDTGEVAACGDDAVEPNSDIEGTFDLIEQLAHAPTDEALTDKSVAEWFEERCGAARAKRVIPLLDAFYANDLCSDLRSLGVAEAAWEARHWSDGEDTLVKGGTMAPLTTALARGVPVRMGWPVREVRWRAQGSPWAAGASGAAGGHAGEAAVEIEGENGEVLRARTVICAVPLTQLQKQALRFAPAPGATFQQTLDATRVHNALKIWAVFRVPFWKTLAPRLPTGHSADAEESDSCIPDALALEGVASVASDEADTSPDTSDDSADASDGSSLSRVASPQPGDAPRAPRVKAPPSRSLTFNSVASSSTKSLGAHSAHGDPSSSDGDSSSSEDEESVEPREGDGAAAPANPEFWNMLCPGCAVPEFWEPRHAPDGLEEPTGITAVCAEPGSGGCSVAAPLRAESVHVLQGFACAAKADELAALGATSAVQTFIDQLDQVFKMPGAKSLDGQRSSDTKPGPASAAFVRGGIMDWAKEPYIEGGYSSPSPGVAAGARAALHALPGGTVFFAGEHTHERLNACLQGAMETGVRAAAQVRQSLGMA